MFLSPARNTFRYTLSWCIAVALLFVPLVLWAAYDFYRSRHVDSVLAFFTVAFGLLFAYAWLWTKTRVTLHEEGISYKSPFREKDLRGTKSRRPATASSQLTRVHISGSSDGL